MSAGLFHEVALSKIAKLQGELEDPDLYAREPKRFDTLMAKLTDLQSKLSDAEDTWLELEMLAEEDAAG